MKRCPECNRTYADETLAFCLADGALLSAPFDPQATQRLPGRKSTNETPTEILPGGVRDFDDRERVRPPKSFYLAVTLLAVVVVGGLGLWLWRDSLKPNPAREIVTPGPTTVSSPSPQPSLSPDIKSTPKPDATPSPTAENKPDLSYLTGTYSLFRLENPASGAIGKMTITVRAGSNIFVRGDGWKGSGRMTDGKQGYYDWEFEDGKFGRTTILVNDDGSLQGRVFGSGLDWWYLARRQK